jgi:hypothetical protein
MRKLLCFFVVVWLVACSSIDCPVQNIVSVQYEVYDKEGKILPLTDSLSVVTAQLNGENVDITALLNSGEVTLNKLIGKSAFSLPISYSHPEDILLFCFKDSVKTLVDTVWIKKEDFPHFESVDCSAAFFHEITGVRHTRNYIDSLVLLNNSVTYDQTTVHFRLVPKSND